MYIEASGRSKKKGYNAKISKTVSLTGSSCLSFSYHMYGKRMGTLKVLFGNQVVFTESGNKGNQWHSVKDIPLPGSGNKQVGIKALRAQ